MNGETLATEPGASDNRLSLSIGDNPFLKSLEDGNEYDLVVKVRQASPGEFVVIKASPASGGGEAEEEGEGEEMMSEGGKGESEPAADSGEADYPNPAVARMMRGKRGQMMGE